MSISEENTLTSADALLRLQAAVNRQLSDLSIRLRDVTGLASVKRTCDVLRYPNNTRTDFEGCISVETTSRATVDFWLEFGSDEKRLWRVEADILQGPNAIDEYRPPQPLNIAQLETAVIEACKWLVNKAEAFSFDELK